MTTFEQQFDETFKKAVIGKICKCNDNVSSKLKSYAMCSQQIGFTLTFDSSYHNLDSDVTYQFMLNYVNEHFKEDDKYIITTEFTKSGVLHFHGIVFNAYQRYVSKLLVEWKKIYGMVRMEFSITSKWRDYIIKDMDIVGYPVILTL